MTALWHSIMHKEMQWVESHIIMWLNGLCTVYNFSWRLYSLECFALKSASAGFPHCFIVQKQSLPSLHRQHGKQTWDTSWDVWETEICIGRCNANSYNFMASRILILPCVGGSLACLEECEGSLSMHVCMYEYVVAQTLWRYTPT